MLLQLSNVSYSVSQNFILNHINFSVQENEFITLIGPNGAGKSTLLKLCAKLIKPTSGFIQLAAHKKIGYMPQKITLNSHLNITVEKFLSLKPHIDKDEVHLKIELLNIHSLLHKPLQKLSGGQMQRVLLAYTLLGDPELILMDEPTQGLDIYAAEEFAQILSDYLKNKKTSVIMVSHDLHVVFEKSDKVICLNHHICCESETFKIESNQAYSKKLSESLPTGLKLYVHHHNHTHSIKDENEC